MSEQEEAHRQYIETRINPMLEEMVTQMLISKPADPPTYMLEYLMNKSGKKAILNGKEKDELSFLRKEVARLKSTLQPVLANHASEEESEEDEEDEVPDLPLPVGKKAAGAGRISVSAEVFGHYNPKEDFKARFFAKTQEQKARIVDKLSKAFMFSALDPKELEIVIGAMEERHAKAEQAVITQGDDGDELFVVDSGKLECTKVFAGETVPKKLKEYFPGDAFGELALLYNTPRAASITAMMDSVLWVLDRGTFNHIVKDSAVRKREQYEGFMAKSPLFQELESYERANIADAFKSVSFDTNTYIVREGDWGDIFYMIEDGTAIATKSLEPGTAPVQVKEYSPGDYFGELSLLRGEPRAANIISTSPITCATLDRRSFKRMLGPLEDILKRNADSYNKFVSKA